MTRLTRDTFDLDSINNGYDTVTWERMVSIKQKILRIWDTATPSVRICCIKFAQRVVLAQSVASGPDFRHGGALDVSLEKVPPSHQSLDTRTLKAEAMGLLDRMLSVLQDSSDCLIVDATLNCLSILARTRPATSGRIINALLNFNPLQAANSPMTPKSRVMIKSTEKTSRLLLVHLSKRDSHNPIVPRIQQHVERTMRAVAEVIDDSAKKRPLEAPTAQDGLEAKRQRTAESQVYIRPLGPGSHSLGDSFTLTSSDELRKFDISQLPLGLVARVSVIALAGLDSELLAKAVDGVRGRLVAVVQAPPELNPNTAPLGVDDDDEDEYEPDFYQEEDTEQILKKLDGTSAARELPGLEGSLALKSLSLPAPAELTREAALKAGSGTVSRVVEMMKSVEEPVVKKAKAGFNRLAASSGGRCAWTLILTRLATRSSAGTEKMAVKAEEKDPEPGPEQLCNRIREVLYNYIMEDFRQHMDVAVSWLCEEWYNDKIQGRTRSDHAAYYEKCALRLLGGFLPYLHPQDRVLTRFLSEIPELSKRMLSQVKSMCRDPSVTQLALTSLLYLVMMRPPIKDMALDTVQDIWSEFEDARPMAGKYLGKYRLSFLAAAESDDRPGAAQGQEDQGAEKTTTGEGKGRGAGEGEGEGTEKEATAVGT